MSHWSAWDWIAYSCLFAFAVGILLVRLLVAPAPIAAATAARVSLSVDPQEVVRLAAGPLEIGTQNAASDQGCLLNIPLAIHHL